MSGRKMSEARWSANQTGFKKFHAGRVQNFSKGKTIARRSAKQAQNKKALAMTTKITLSDLARELRAKHGVCLSYPQAWRKVSGGEIPAERISGKWYINATDLPSIAQTLAAK